MGVLVGSMGALPGSWNESRDLLNRPWDVLGVFLVPCDGLGLLRGLRGVLSMFLNVFDCFGRSNRFSWANQTRLRCFDMLANSSDFNRLAGAV